MGVGSEEKRKSELNWTYYRYDDVIYYIIKDFSDHNDSPISELEVFIGSVINRQGIQDRHQRDRSNRLKEEIERVSMWATELMRPMGDGVVEEGEVLPPEFETDTHSLELCFACVCRGTGTNPLGAKRHGQEFELKSFRIVAACALLGEISLFEKGKKKAPKAEAKLTTKGQANGGTEKEAAVAAAVSGNNANGDAAANGDANGDTKEKATVVSGNAADVPTTGGDANGNGIEEGHVNGHVNGHGDKAEAAAAADGDAAAAAAVKGPVNGDHVERAANGDSGEVNGHEVEGGDANGDAIKGDNANQDEVSRGAAKGNGVADEIGGDAVKEDTSLAGIEDADETKVEGEPNGDAVNGEAEGVEAEAGVSSFEGERVKVNGVEENNIKDDSNGPNDLSEPNGQGYFGGGNYVYDYGNGGDGTDSSEEL